MKIKYVALLIIGILSFYYSDKLIIYIEQLSPLMKQIKSEEDKYNLLPVNAEIKDDTIVPGIKGKKVNERESYLKMNEFGVFNETFFKYDYIKPELSIEDNLDKFIVSSVKKDKIALIVNNESVSNYLVKNNINHSLIINDSKKKNELIEYINGNNELDEYIYLDRYLTKNKMNKKICIEGINDINYCKKNKYYLIRILNQINKNNILNSIKNIKGGSFIYIDGKLQENEIEIILNKIKKDNLSIDKLSSIISEIN